jgi:transcriptional regulator with XRE-family HTH domain
MITEQRRKELAEFLRTQRGRVSPDKLGLRSTTRRRVGGLRRDEVAELADISVTWYTWLEQGRDINVSSRALERIATALQCADDERSYLFQLAGENPPQPGPRAVEPPANLQLLLDALDPNPAYVVCPRFDVIAWNASATDVFGDFGRYPDNLRNLLWILLTDPSMQELFVEWERFVRCLLAWFRRAIRKRRMSRSGRAWLRHWNRPARTSVLGGNSMKWRHLLIGARRFGTYRAQWRSIPSRYSSIPALT